MFTILQRTSESLAILGLRLTFGDEFVKEQSKRLSPQQLSELTSEHWNQTVGIIRNTQ